MMHPFTYLIIQCLSLLLLLLFFTSISALPKPINYHKLQTKNIYAKISENNTEFKTFYYDQILDHFNYQLESYTTFKQKYVMNYENWGGDKSNSPIFVFLGAESPLDYYTIHGLIMKNYSLHFKALLLFIEHRFYGESIPFGMSKEKVMKNAKIRGYFNSAQALADYAELILHVKQKLNAHYSPVIVIGGSYSGMLATWFRLKYPHIALGALASSAPILYFDNIISPNHGYFSVVTKDFKETSESCFEIIRDSWMMIDKIGQEPNGLSILSEKFNTCEHLNNTGELKDYLQEVYSSVAQYNFPPITSICNAIDNGSHGTDILSRIYAALVEFSGNLTCQEINNRSPSSDSILGWEWQICSEMVMPIVPGTSKNSMFPHETFNLTNYIKKCKDKYNVVPRPHWITTYYGGQDLKLILKAFGSNIIFSNGLRDPYSSAGVLETLSDSLIALYTINGTHVMDIMEPEENDPDWLVHQRQREIEIINEWLRQYYEDLKKYLK